MPPKAMRAVVRRRGPSAAVAKQVLKKRKLKQVTKDKACSAEAKFRRAGGYGRAVVSIFDAPAGGIENSPAYRKMVSRCEVDARGRPPPPEQRDGAPLKGGYPLHKYPVNVLVDGMRASWLPDDWAQVIKNTGPGGSYLGWMSPEGKFFYHRSGYPTAIEETMGRKLTVMDGLNGLKRRVRNIVKPGADREFLRQCLSPSERRCLAPARTFHFAVVSARRAACESGQHDIMVIEGHFKQVGVKPTWYVDADSLSDYKKLGLRAKVGGKLTPARNMALDDARKSRKVCVQVSDDISAWTYHDIEKQDFRGEQDFKKANATLAATKKHVVSPLAAAQWILAKMRSDPGRPHLGGIFPTANAAMSLGSQEYGKSNFILGDFFVALPSSPCRFDTAMTLKEDYDYTCSHISTHGCVLRCNRMLITVKHSTNVGGAVSTRDDSGSKERENIAILQRKWPGVFSINPRRKAAGCEVVMHWKNHRDGQGGDTAPKRGAAAAGPRGGASSTAGAAPSKLRRLVGLGLPAAAVLRYTRKKSAAGYINNRCRQCHLKPAHKCLGMTYEGSEGKGVAYRITDLKYDMRSGRLEVAS